MAVPDRALWPYGTLAALIAAPVIAIGGAVVVLALRARFGWPGEAATGWAMLAVLLASLAPLGLRVLDFLADRRAVVGSQWFNLDLSRVDLARAAATDGAVVLPPNLGVTGPVISDTTPMDIMAALEEATRHDIAVVDIRDGDSWWVTRLLAFAAGAARRGSPEAIVFVGRRGNRPGQFLGWAPPRAVLDAILADREPYAERYARATAIAAQLALYRGGQFLPQGLMLDFDVQRYTQPPQDYSALGAAALEQVVMDQLAQQGPDGSLEDPPDRLTLARLGALFGAVLVTESVDVGASGAAQAEAALAAHGPFVALVREGSFIAMLRSADAERAILRQLVRQGAG